jgi:DNA polymerase-3 subunit delta'
MLLLIFIQCAKISHMNWDLLGNESAVDLLGAHLRADQVRHAYLFSGPSGIGRRTLALRLVQALNCPQTRADGSPCRICRVCRQIEKMQHADLFVVQAEKEGGTLKVDQIRELQHRLSTHPYETRYKAALILRFEEAHVSAMNALLKTLEEPNPQVIILLTADNPENLLPTIVSRCEIVRLHPMSVDQLQAGLQREKEIPENLARLYAHLSGGRPGLALRMGNNPALLEERSDWLGELANMMACGTVERFGRADSLSKDKDRLRSMLTFWLSFWRDIFLKNVGSSSPIINLDWESSAEYAAERLSAQSVRKIVISLQSSLGLLDRNVNQRLVLENILLDLPRIKLQQD